MEKSLCVMNPNETWINVLSIHIWARNTGVQHLLLLRRIDDRIEQSWALAVFFNLINNSIIKKIFLHFLSSYKLTGSRFFK